MDTQLSKFWRPKAVTTFDHLTLAAHPPYLWYGFERTGRTHGLHPTRLIGALFEFFTRILVSCWVKVLTP
jgi:hypothetical protein